MSTSFYAAVVSSDVDSPLSCRHLIPDGHDGSPMLDYQGLPINTSIDTLEHIDKVIFPHRNSGPGVPLQIRGCHVEATTMLAASAEVPL